MESFLLSLLSKPSLTKSLINQCQLRETRAIKILLAFILKVFDNAYLLPVKRKSSILHVKFSYSTNQRLSSLNFSANGITKIIRHLQPNQAHDYDKLSSRLLKISYKSACKPLTLIFNRYLTNGEILSI